MSRFFCLFLILIHLAGCAHFQAQDPHTEDIQSASAPEVIQPSNTNEPTFPETQSQTEQEPSINLLTFLMVQYQEWKGTRYRMGGLSKSGVDCSGFALLTFRNQFGIELPRSTYEQNKLGQEIKPDQLQAGDLVFFHTGRNNHVGIYLQDNQFLHASTRAGVKISSLSEPYWKRRYWKAKRLDLQYKCCARQS